MAIPASEICILQIPSVAELVGAASGKPPPGPPREQWYKWKPWAGDAARKNPSRFRPHTFTPPRPSGPLVPRGSADSLLSEAAVPWPSLGPAFASSAPRG